MSTREATRALRAAAIEAAEAAGFNVSRQTGVGRGPNQRLVLERDGETLTAALRTSRDQWVAFPPDGEGGWRTLDDVDAVLLSIVDQPQDEDATSATVWLVPAEVARPRFDAMADIMSERGSELRPGMGVWVHAKRLDDDHRYAAGSGMVEGIEPLAESVAIEPGAQPELDPADEREAFDASPVDAAIATLADELGIDPARISISISGRV